MAIFNVERIFWNDVELTGHPFITVLQETEGLFMPPFEYTEDKQPYGHGSILRQFRAQPREVDLHLLIQASGPLELRNNIRETLRMFNPLNGDGRLTVEINGERRTLRCRYVGGMEGQQSNETSGPTFQRLMVTLRAFEPFWEDEEPKVYSFEVTKNPVKWFPIFPLQLGSQGVNTEVQVVNNGDIEAFPSWTLYGPGTDPKIYLPDGRFLSFTGLTISEGDVLFIDTKNRTLEKSDGSNVFPKLDWGSSFGGLEPGINRVRFGMKGTNEFTKVELAFKQRYLSV